MKIEIKVLDKAFYNADRSLPGYATLGSAAIDLICTKDVTIAPQERLMIPTGLAIWLGSAHSRDQSDVLAWCSTIDTQMAVAGLILPRSGLGTKGLVLANTVGLIDEDFQGQLMVSAWNSLQSHIVTTVVRENGQPLKVGAREGVFLKEDERVHYKEEEANAITIKAGDRFAQLLLLPVIKASWKIVEEFSSSTDRGVRGFGSTDKGV